ncbi:hypothetical protein HDU96_003309 [Phlyctochytrium bullatum]|nr:hypothetical protein HDU96_003309 [Phlyctochytrium bullatum]
MSLVNLSLTVLTGLATTLAAGVVVSFGLHFLIRDHNLRTTLDRFRKRHDAVILALREIEASCESMLAPALEDLAIMWSVSQHSSLTPSPSPPSHHSKISSRALLSPIDSIDAVDAAIAKYNPRSSATSSSSSTPSSSTQALSDTDSDVHTPHSHHLHHRRRTSVTDREATLRRLMELDDHVLGLLERLDSINPSDLAVDMVGSTQDAVDLLDVASTVAPAPAAPAPLLLAASAEQDTSRTSSTTALAEGAGSGLLAMLGLRSTTETLPAVPVASADSLTIASCVRPPIPSVVTSCSLSRVPLIPSPTSSPTTDTLPIIPSPATTTTTPTTPTSTTSLPLVPAVPATPSPSRSLLPSFPPLSPFPPLDSVSLDAATATHILTCVARCETRKRKAAERVRGLRGEVERLRGEVEATEWGSESEAGEEAGLKVGAAGGRRRGVRRVRVFG